MNASNRQVQRWLRVAVLVLSAWSPFVTDAPGDERIAQLLAEAWRELPASMDVTLVHTRRRRPPDEQKIREKHQRAIAKAQSEATLPERLHANLEAAIQEEIRWSSEPLRVVRRIRFAGDRQRIDQSVLQTDEPDDVPALFRETLVDAGVTGDGHFESWEHQALAKTAIQNLTRSKRTYRQDDVRYLGTIGEAARTTLQIATGDKAAAQRREMAADPDKVAALANGTHPGFVIVVESDSWQSRSADRFEISLRDQPDHPAIVIHTAAGDCSCAFETEHFDPKSGRPVLRLTQERQESEDLPQAWRKETFHDDGFHEVDEFKVVEAILNPPIPDEAFAFYVPTGWRRVIRRPGSTITALPDQPAQAVLPVRNPSNDKSSSLGFILIINALIVGLMMEIRRRRRKSSVVPRDHTGEAVADEK